MIGQSLLLSLDRGVLFFVAVADVKEFLEKRRAWLVR
jgi:hypothetical protein